MKPQIFVFGEIHNEKKSVEMIQQAIRELKPSILLHELLYEDVCNRKEEIEQRLRTRRNGGLCDPRLNQDVYELGKELNMKLVGIDTNDPTIYRKPMNVQFALREAYMLRCIKKYTEMDFQVPTAIVIVVSDTHLREKFSKQLGVPSPLMTYFKTMSNVNVQRAPKNMQEIP